MRAQGRAMNNNFRGEYAGKQQRGGKPGPSAMALSSPQTRQLFSFIDQSRFRDAAALMNALADENQSFATMNFFHSLLRACVEKRNPIGAGWCFDRMIEAGIAPNLFTFTQLLNACAKVGDISGTEKWWEKMKDFGVEPNGVTYNIAINACAQGRNAHRAEMWLKRMIDDRASVSCVTFGTVIDCYAKVGDLEKAEFWANTMQDHEFPLDRVVFNSLLNACAKVGEPEKAEHWLALMQSKGLEPNEKAYNSLIHACSKAGQPKKAEAWFRTMQQSGCKVDVIGYSSMIHVAAKVGDADKAEEWMLEMISVGLIPNTICYNTLFHACALTGHHEKAATWMSKMHMAGAAKPNEITYNCLIDACVNAGNKTAASTWLQEMIEQGLDPDDTTLLKLSGGGSKCKSRTPQVPAWACNAIIAGYSRRGDARGVQYWTRVANDVGCAIAGAPGSSNMASQDAPGNFKGRRPQKATRQPQGQQRSLRDSMQQVLPVEPMLPRRQFTPPSNGYQGQQRSLQDSMQQVLPVEPTLPRRQFTPPSNGHQADATLDSSFPEPVLSECGHAPLYVQAGSASPEYAQRARTASKDSATPFYFEPKARMFFGNVGDAMTKPSALSAPMPFPDSCSARPTSQSIQSTPSTSVWPALTGGAGLLDGNQQPFTRSDIEGLRRLAYQPPPGLEASTVQKLLSPAELQAIFF